MRVINIVDNVTKVNFGIWNAAVATAQALQEQHDVRTELWAPPADQNPESAFYTYVPVADISVNGLDALIQSRQLDPQHDIIVTHGTWRYATKWGATLAKRGYKWVSVPHGMLRWWCMKIKGWKKFPFFFLAERPMIQRAAAIRAVSQPEFDELKNEQFSRHPNVFLQPNCTTLPSLTVPKTSSPKIVVFMARIHPGKRVVQLAKAWTHSKLHNNPDFQLVIAGPDDGALAALQATLQASESHNITYAGPQYGDEKARLLASASYYVLPSEAESFPTSVVEALSYGLVSLITPHCNFPEVIRDGIGIEIGTEPDTIVEGLNSITEHSPEQWQHLSQRGIDLIRNGYSDTGIAAQQVALYRALLQPS